MNFKIKAITFATAVAGALGFAGSCFAYGILDVASGSVATIMTYTTDLFTDVWVIVALAVGLPLAFYVIRKVISMVRVR